MINLNRYLEQELYLDHVLWMPKIWSLKQKFIAFKHLIVPFFK